MLNNEWQSVFSMNDKWEMEYIEKIAKELYESKGEDLLILEIGSFHGQSTVLLANYGKVLCIDLFADLHDGLLNYDKIGQGHFIDFIKNIIRFKLIDRVFPIISTSDFLKELPYMNFDLIFVDGCHKYLETLKDLDKSSRHLKEDGFLIVHDYKRDGYARPPYNKDHPHHTFDPSKDPWAGVAKAVDEFVELGEFSIYEHYSGVVNLRRKEYVKEIKVWP